jgi:hydroxymethylbilane synthase
VQSVLLRIGTRGSPLALAQARLVREQLMRAHGLDEAAIEITIIRTSGDIIQDRPLSEAGGKGLFTKEIEQALLDNAIDLAVHSAKDMPTFLPDRLMISACLPREDVRDVFVSRKAATLAELPDGAVVGTASLRRQALVKKLRPDVRIISLRGNVQTRLRKLDDGVADATLLALAGLKRLKLESTATQILSIDDFPPAVGQGAIAIETRADDKLTGERVAAIDDADTRTALVCERAFLTELDGSCRTPIAGHARLRDGTIDFRGLIVRPDGSESHAARRRGAIADAASIGTDAGRELKHRAAPDFFVDHHARSDQS